MNAPLILFKPPTTIPAPAAASAAQTRNAALALGFCDVAFDDACKINGRMTSAPGEPVIT